MAEVGNRVTVASTGASRSGVVTAVNGAMITVRWDTGGETSIIPGPGVLSVITHRRRAPSVRTRPTTSGATAATKKTSATSSPSADVKKPVAKKIPGSKKTL